MNLIFLDIDGVLNNHTKLESGFCGIDSEMMKQLNKLIKSYNCKIVIISAWRYMISTRSMTLDGFSNMMRTHGMIKDRIIGYTETDEIIPNRLDQVSNWLIMHFLGTIKVNFVIIDDLEPKDYYGDWEKYRVKPNSLVGLTDLNIIQVGKILLENIYEL